MSHLRALAIAALSAAVLATAAAQLAGREVGEVCVRGEECGTGICINNRCGTSAQLRRALAPWAIASIVLGVLACIFCVSLCVCFARGMFCFRKRQQAGVVISNSAQPQQQQVQYAPQPTTYTQSQQPQQSDQPVYYA